MAAIFGNYPGVPPEAKGVTAVGGTILEVAAIDDPAIGKFLGEVKAKKTGPETTALATKILNSMLPGLGAQPSQASQAAQPPAAQPQTKAIPTAEAKAAKATLATMREQAAQITPLVGDKGTGETIRVKNVGSFVSGRNMFGFGEDKFFDPDGNRITKDEFEATYAAQTRRLTSQSTQTVQPQPSVAPSQPGIVPSTTNQNLPPPTAQNQQPSIVTLPNGQQVQAPNTSSSMAGQKQVPSIGSRDLNNTEFLVIKSIYNIVG